ncbi:DUF2953 domain-containing protein [Herbivorax sp. ANBcel31]|uniref:DUF2953 domain-containing protein n=1 Tax=Herbivorax sp. ANBcel31 TaxID=3069754 RepID=UPI0027B35406|nr:DUF2953 domain-containing protein [Herbivorax sp. ANBcel31]MDQ2085753.1 DUF2953 domain-containing protein [Herbivorax sp. ANBcel31]
MNRVIFFIAILIVLAIIILLSKINIVIEYKKKYKDDVFVLSFFLYKGLIKYKYEVPSVDTKGTGILYRFIKEKGKKEKKIKEGKEYTTYSSIIDRIKNVKLFYSRHCSLIKKIQNFLRCKIILKNLNFNMKLGTGDALQTSILTGLSWTFSGIIISFLYQFIKIEKKQIIIQPDYKGKSINLDLYCIFNVRIVYIIVIGFTVLIHFIKNRVITFKAQKCVGG